VSELDEINETLRSKGYREAQLAAFPAPKGKALLKGLKIVSPFSDTAETVLRVARDLVPPADELGRRSLTPRELREALSGS
jgi:hypothetical protein